jgi:DNA-binding HxlR family transcriptional regulator/putative sterol carrier protein
MLNYGDFCPVSKAAEILGEKWTLLIVRELLMGSTRFSQFERAIPRISATVLNTRLNTLEQCGVIIRKRTPEQRGHEYQLTESGRELYPIVMQVGEWGMRWARGQMSDDELGVETLMSDIYRRIDTNQLPGGQTVIQFHFTDLSQYSRWWVKVNDGKSELCADNPGTEVDVYITTDLRTMTEVWMGDLSIDQAQASNKLKIVGLSQYLRNIRAWLGLHLLAEVRPVLSR